MKEGWFCPTCGSSHAPDVQTCPSGGRREFIPFAPIIPVPFYPYGVGDCYCPRGNYVCGSAACPRRTTIITCADGAAGAMQ